LISENFPKVKKLSGSVITILIQYLKMNNLQTEPFIHHVYFWLKNPNNLEDRAKLIEGLKALAKVPEIQQHYIGTPAATNRGVIDTTYAVSWLCFFENLEEQQAYQVHPIHLKFIEDCSHLWEKVIVYDSVDAK
jgi:3-phenylpropionate/cinnamic acid dioxygenase small subunit